MSAMASQITCVSIVYFTVSSGADQRKHQGSASLAFVRGFHRSPVISPHKGPVKRKMFPFDDAIICFLGGPWHDAAMTVALISSIPYPIRHKVLISCNRATSSLERKYRGHFDNFRCSQQRTFRHMTTFPFQWKSLTHGSKMYSSKRVNVHVYLAPDLNRLSVCIQTVKNCWVDADLQV